MNEHTQYWGETGLPYRYPGCSHHQTPVKVGRHTVYCSGYYSWTWQERATKEQPDLGVYLDTIWMGTSAEILGWGDFDLPKPDYDTILIDWQDYATTNMDNLKWAISIIIKYLQRGKRVELGCFGGHGRTGTLLACLIAKVENISAYTAILAVYNRYCAKAIESRAQMEQVFAFVGQKPKQKHYKKLGFHYLSDATTRQLTLAELEENPDAIDGLTTNLVTSYNYANIGGRVHVRCKDGQLRPLSQVQRVDGAWVPRIEEEEDGS